MALSDAPQARTDRLAQRLAGRLDGMVAVVTGASPNIGGVAASGFAAAGAKVV